MLPQACALQEGQQKAVLDTHAMQHRRYTGFTAQSCSSSSLADMTACAHAQDHLDAPVFGRQACLSSHELLTCGMLTMKHKGMKDCASLDLL